MQSKFSALHISHILALLIGSCINMHGFAQSAIAITPLAPTISESSGLIQLDGKLFTHNDSGGLSALYEIDSISGNVVRTIDITNAQNVDWEDLCFDETYVYIGDFGNNNGTRTDLVVYKIERSELEAPGIEEVSAEIIQFSYADQENFEPAPFQTNYDAEAMVASNDSLYIFSKNWGDNHCRTYALSKEPGNYDINPAYEFISDGLITGADYNFISNNLVLCGYQNFLNPFLIQVEGFPTAPISEDTFVKSNVELEEGYSVQIEGIAFHNTETIYLTGEENFSGSAGLHRLLLDQTNGVLREEETVGKIFPNPASDSIQIEHHHFAKAKIYGMDGKLYLKSKASKFDISKLKSANYIVVVYNSDGREIWRTNMLVQ